MSVIKNTTEKYYKLLVQDNITPKEQWLLSTIKNAILLIEQSINPTNSALSNSIQPPCKDCDSFKFKEDNQLKNLWRISLHYKIDYQILLKLNSHLKPTKMKKGEAKSLVILAHDTAEVHLKEALEDKDEIEKYARNNDTKIEYVNLSELFNRITGKNVDKSTPNY